MMIQYFLAQLVTPSASATASASASPVATATASVAPSVSASPVAETSLDLAVKGIQTFGNIRSTDAIPAAMERLWQVTMTGNMYKMISGFGLMIAIVAVGFWCVKFYKTLEEGGVRPAVNDLVIPLLLVILLSNGGSQLRDMTIGTRNIMNGINRSVTRTVSAEIDLKTAIGTLAANSMVRDMIEQGLNNCKVEIDPAKLQRCIEKNVVGVQFVRDLFTKLRAENNANNNTPSRDDFELWQSSLLTYRLERLQAATVSLMARNATETPAVANSADSNVITTPATSVTATSSNASIDLRSITDYSSSKEIRATILSMRGAFIYIIEVVMLVTALVGPIFVALSLFPSGSKFLLNWGASFLSLGFCKICYSLISGLSALAMVYVGPKNSDMLVISLVLGLFAPVLSFGIASGSGISILSTMSSVGQNYGVNTGVNGYHKSKNDRTGNAAM
jgi:hypothetical protein